MPRRRGNTVGSIVSALETIHHHWRDLFDRRMKRFEIRKYGKIFPKEFKAWSSAKMAYKRARKANNWAKAKTAKITRKNAGKAFYAKVNAYIKSKKKQDREEQAEFGKMFPEAFMAWREAGKRKLDARKRKNRVQYELAKQEEMRAGRAFFAKVKAYKKTKFLQENKNKKAPEPKSKKPPAPKARKVRKTRMSKEERMYFAKMFPEEFEAWKASGQKSKAAKKVERKTRKRGGKAYKDARIAFKAAQKAMRTAGKAFWAKVKAYKTENAEKK